MPPELQRVQMIDLLCQRWHCLPSELLREDAGLVYGMLGALGEAEGGSVAQDGIQDGDNPWKANSGHPGDMERALAAASRSL